MKKVVFAFLIFVTANVCAGWQEGRVTQIKVRESDGLHYFFLSGAPVSRPACAAYTYWMIKNEHSVAGKSQFSMLVTAYVSGATVKVIGTNECSRWKNGEDVDSIRLK